MTLKYHGRAVLRLAASSAVCWIALAYAALPAAAAAPTWQSAAKIAGIIDVGGPRPDGSLVVMGSGKLWLVDSQNKATAYPGTYGDDKTAEAYLTVVPQLPPEAATSSACKFQRGDVYALRLHAPLGINKVDAQGQKTAFANVTGVTALTGITFDDVGSFGYRIIVTGTAAPGKTQVAVVDCLGNVTAITATGPVMEGGITVAPRTFGSFGGMLIAPDELSGNINAVASDGSSKKVVASGLAKGADIGVEGVGFVPHGWQGSVYFADHVVARGSHPGTDSLLALTSNTLAGAGVKEGDLLAATEGGAVLIDVRCTSTCTVQPIISTATKAHGDGHLVFTGATPVPPSPSPSPAPVLTASTSSEEVSPQIAVAIATVALVVLVAAVVLVTLDLRSQGR